MMATMNKSERMACNSHLLRTFIAVAESKSITRAAEHLGRTQSAISVQSKSLEETLEVDLFVRQSTGMELTAEGEKLLPVARHVVSELTRIGTMFEEPLQGRLRVGIPDDYAESVLESVLVQFANRHPGVEVSAIFGCTSRFPDAIKKNTLDVAVVSEGVKAKNRMTAVQNVWLASPELRIDQFKTVPLAIIDRDCSWRSFGSDALTSIGKDWRIAYASENFTGVKAAIRSGLAVSPLPRLLKEATMVELGEKEGFPRLPSTPRGILVSDQAPEDTAQAMLDAIKSATLNHGIQEPAR